MSDTRKQNMVWTVCGADDKTVSFDGAQLAVLMDVREELQCLNRTLSCYNLSRHEEILKRIARNTTKRKRAKK